MKITANVVRSFSRSAASKCTLLTMPKPILMMLGHLKLLLLRISHIHTTSERFTFNFTLF